MTMPPGSGRDGVVLCGAYELEPNRAHPLMDELPDVVHLRASTDQSPQLQAVVGLLAAELERPGAAAGAAASAGVGVSALLDLLFLHALRAWFEGRRAASEQTGQNGAQNGGWAAALRDPAVSAALRAMHHEPGRGWTVAELATVGDLSRAPFARRFTTLTGRAPLAYLTWWRMTIAARMLRDSDVPLRVIAQRVGYATEFAFAAAFKRQFGTAPGRFRRDRPPQP
jgi:transcriptional regulator GlxA family with amidase domain